jgi:hypothetical protein
MKHLSLILASMFILVSFASAQTLKKETVRFARGSSEASLTRTLAPNASIEFSINARRGQTMNYTVGYDFAETDLEAFFTEAQSQNAISIEPKNPNNETVLRATGNHRILVKNKTRKRVTFTLYVDVQ